MSYEYSAESKSLDLPNPYRIENVFRAITAGAEITVGLALLILSRHQLFSEHHYQGVAVLLPVAACRGRHQACTGRSPQVAKSNH